MVRGCATHPDYMAEFTHVHRTKMSSSQTGTVVPKKMPSLMNATFLGPGEQFIWEARPSAWLYYPLPLFVLFLVVVYNAFIWDSIARANNWAFANSLPQLPSTLNSVSGPTSVDSIPVMIGLVLLMLAIIFFAVRWYRRATTVYALSNTRFIRQKGIISKDFDEIQLSQIRGIEVSQAWYQRLLGYGTVKLSAESGTANSLGNEKWAGFPSPTKFQRAVETAQERLSGVASRGQPQGRYSNQGGNR